MPVRTATRQNLVHACNRRGTTLKPPVCTLSRFQGRVLTLPHLQRGWRLQSSRSPVAQEAVAVVAAEVGAEGSSKVVQAVLPAPAVLCPTQPP